MAGGSTLKASQLNIFKFVTEAKYGEIKESLWKGPLQEIIDFHYFGLFCHFSGPESWFKKCKKSNSYLQKKLI